MKCSFTLLFSVLGLVGLTLLACGTSESSSGTGGGDGDGDGVLSGDGDGDSGGDGDGDQSGDGDGVLSGDGDGDSGGDGDGDLSGDGDGDGGLVGDACRDSGDCDSTVGERCFAPGETQDYACGAPDWCGQCSCGPEPSVPLGSGTVCSTPAECPDEEGSAKVCHPELASCQQCAGDEDCTGDRPFCALEEYSYTSQCFECKTNEDCPAERPACDKVHVSTVGEAGTCVACVNNADCPTGLCNTSAKTCYLECETDAQCAGYFQRTCQQNRCVPAPCTIDDDCGPQGTCSGSGCIRTTCSADADCNPGSPCVLGFCQAEFGTCQEELAVPGGG